MTVILDCSVLQGRLQAESFSKPDSFASPPIRPHKQFASGEVFISSIANVISAIVSPKAVTTSGQCYTVVAGTQQYHTISTI